MVHQKVPDELVLEILRYRLCITPLCPFLQRSLDWPVEGPYRPPDPDFATFPADRSLLLVCKQWNAVGTPLFYETVVLRTMTQVQRLASTLKAKPALGEYVRNVRLEGAYGKGLETVLLALPNLHSLALRANMRTKDSNVGLLHALPKVQPTRLCVFDVEPKQGAGGGLNPKTCALHDAICRAISKEWTSLEEVFLAGAPSAQLVWDRIRAALAEAPTLKFVSLPVFDVLPCLHDLALFANPSIQAVRCRADLEWAEEVMNDRKIPEEVRERIQWIDINES